MTELQAWVYLAWLWDNPYPADELAPDYPWADGSAMAVDVDGNGVACGLCDSIANLPNLPTFVGDGMLRKIPKRHMRCFVWATTRNGAKQRAAFCRKQARLLAPKKKKGARK